MAKDAKTAGDGGMGLRGLMRRGLAPRPVETVSLPGLGSVLPGKTERPTRSGNLPPLVDLSKRAKLLLLAGPGSSGKTTTANFLFSLLSEGGMRNDILVAATDPGVVGLAHFLPEDAVHQPEDRTQAAAEALTADVFAEAGSEDPPPVAIVDTGGGSNALQAFLRRNPKAIERLEAKGSAVVLLWHWTPRTMDLALLNDFRASCPKPTATVMVLSGAFARDGWRPYETLRGQEVYQQALREGAAEVFMPPLQQEVALMVERRGILFHSARGGKLHPWKEGKVEPVAGDAAMEVGLWMAEAADGWGEARGWVAP